MQGGFAQQVDIKPLIQAWKVSDTSQSHRAEETYAKLKINGRIRYLAELSALEKYMNSRDDLRLKVRVIMYDLLGKSHFHLPRSADDQPKMETAARSVQLLQDDQLTAELYALLADRDFNNSYLMYNLKSLELQEKVGFPHFCFVHNRFFGASMALYSTADYQKSISYGIRCLQFKNIDVAHWDPRVYIFQLDMVGASYLQLAKYDSTKYYYQKIIDTLMRKPDPDLSFQKLWLGISNGNIGRALALENKYGEAEPLIRQYLKTSIEVESWNNIAMAQNALAEIRLKQKRYQEALDGFKNAYHWSLLDGRLNNKIDASMGLATIYRLTSNIDSAYHYYNLYHQYKDSLTARINQGRYSVAMARINFDNTQSRLEKADARLSREKLTRNFILAGIVFLTVVALLLYRYRMQQVRYREEEIERRRLAAEKEVKAAKIQIDGFIKHIVEKDNLIQDLQKNLRSARPDPEQEVTERLMQYTLVTDAQWMEFRMEFSKAYPAFFSGLKQHIRQVSPAEERLAALMFLKLNAHQIANTLGISKDSVARSKRRLKQRLELDPDTNLEVYLEGLN